MLEGEKDSTMSINLVDTIEVSTQLEKDTILQCKEKTWKHWTLKIYQIGKGKFTRPTIGRYKNKSSKITPNYKDNYWDY